MRRFCRRSLLKYGASAAVAIGFGSLPVSRIARAQEEMVLIDFAKFYEVQKYCSLTNHAWDGFWLIANGRFWKTVPPDLQQILNEHFNDAARKQREDNARLRSMPLRSKRLCAAAASTRSGAASSAPKSGARCNSTRRILDERPWTVRIGPIQYNTAHSIKH
jgi:hypothetical protein